MGIHSIDQIILSCNEDPVYMEFWKPVAWAYKCMFSDVTIHLAFLTNRGEEDELVKEFRQYGKVTLFKPVEDVPEFGQAKMIRFILASQQGDDVCYIDDIDLFPLRTDFILDKTDKRPKNHLLCVGGEVYENNGCYPASQMTAEGYIWKKFINPWDMDYRGLMDHYKRPFFLDRRENICIELDWDNDNYFSDERLIRRLVMESPVDKFEMERGYKDYLESTIDRHTFDKPNDKWVFDEEKLKNHGYYNAHGLRPFGKHEAKYKPIIDYIKANYEHVSQ